MQHHKLDGRVGRVRFYIHASVHYMYVILHTIHANMCNIYTSFNVLCKDASDLRMYALASAQKNDVNMHETSVCLNLIHTCKIPCTYTHVSHEPSADVPVGGGGVWEVKRILLRGRLNGMCGGS